MKHNPKITLIILAMFLLTQFLGIYIVGSYSSTKIVNGNAVSVDSAKLPFGLEVPEIKQNADFTQAFISIIFAFIVAISLMLLLTKFKSEIILRFWFFMVVAIALGISLNIPLKIFIPENLSFLGSPLTWTIALVFGLILSFLKIYKRGFVIHNLTELLIYPGIASVFVPILNVYTILILLILISLYDAWAVWHSGIMQKMVKYQINKLNILAGFFIPTVSKKVKMQMKAAKNSRSKKTKAKKFRVNVALLGGGDVVFPIIAAGVMLKTLGFWSAVFVIVGATLGLSYLLFFSEKKKFYPAMPFISAGIFLAIGLSYLIL